MTEDRATRRPPITGKRLVLLLLGAVLLVFGGVALIGLTGRGEHVPPSRPGIGFGLPPEKPEERLGPGALGSPGGPVEQTVIDRGIRDAMRKRILAARAAEELRAKRAGQGGAPPGSGGEKAAGLESMPHDGGAVDPGYIQSRVREDFIPMAVKCYEELLARDGGAAGKLVVHFTIAGDEKIGGVVDEAELDPESTITDEKMSTCVRESMMSMAFAPPPNSGVVTVTYPFEFSPDEPDGG